MKKMVCGSQFCMGHETVSDGGQRFPIFIESDPCGVNMAIARSKAGLRARVEAFMTRNWGFFVTFMAWFSFHYAHDLILATVVRLTAVDITDYLWVVFIVSLGMTFLTKFLSRFIKVGRES